MLLLLVVGLLQSCHDKEPNPNRNLSLADFATLSAPAYRLNSHRIREEIDRLAAADRDSMAADQRTRAYYAGRSPLVWIDRKGLDSRADSAVAHLQGVARMGFSRRRFRLPQIEADLKRARELRFDDGDNCINRVMARLEYNLTKAYLRYAAGQQFGFVNPTYVFNRLDVHDSDSVHPTYRTLFDLKMRHATRAFFREALRKAGTDSVGPFLAEAEPQDAFYHRLRARLDCGPAPAPDRVRLLVNMERCRWRLADRPQAHRKYVLVNIPSYHLLAVDGDETMTMRVASGTMATKTPVMASRVQRMDINPQWVMPRSIVRKSILPHAGDTGYFRRHRYFVRQRSTGRVVEPGLVTRGMLLDGDYLVVQEGGEGNALGRIIFRFDNGLSIFLHDTSSRNVFAQTDRGVSHGCVRVERPLDLAVFMLAHKDEQLIDRIRCSMASDVSPLGKRRSELTPEMLAVSDTLDRRRLVGTVKVEPAVPIFLYYFTLYPDPDGRIEAFADVYGYDRVIYDILKNYL